MKTKLVLLLLLLATIAYDASAFKIIISGGNRRHKFETVVVTDEIVKCTGSGSNTCPVSFEGDQTLVHKKYDNLDLLVDYVWAQVNGGRKFGNSVYNNWPVSWRMNEETGNLEISVDETTIENPQLDDAN